MCPRSPRRTGLVCCLANSCNLYFAQLAQEVGKELLAMAMAMGLGTKPGIELPAEEVGAGSVPARKIWLQLPVWPTILPWGNKLEVTPLQTAVMLSSIANGGWWVEPRLVLAVNQDLTKKVRPPGVKEEKL